MIFTTSKDGVKRANIHVRLRLTREEWAAICEIAQMRKCTPHEVLEYEAGLAAEGLIDLFKIGKGY